MKQKIDGQCLVATLLFLLMLGLVPPLLFAGDDVVPFFAGQTGSPNVMILFDNSDSMQDSPYLRDDGSTYYPSTNWRRGVKVNPDCNGDGTEDDPCIAENASGNILYDESKYITVSNVMSLPGQMPPNLPGLTSPGSVVTSIRDTSNTCSTGMECDDRIYDSNVNWGYFVDDATSSAWAKMAYTYRYWKIEIKDDLGNVQYRTMNYYNSGGYWRTYGDFIEYDTNRSYTYTLVAGLPGDVTYSHSDPRYIFDRNFDWSTMNWTVYNSLYRGRILEVYQGTNAGETRKIDGYSSNSGYWRMSTAFSQPMDFTSKYRILGDADDGKYAFGGNHPDSKMYQAKLALTQFLNSSSIKACDETDVSGNCIKERFLMNLGFATFLQAREPVTRAKYYRKRGLVHPDQFSYRYKQNRDTSNNIYISNGCSGGSTVTPVTFTDPWDNSVTHSNVDIGYEFDRAYRTGHCDEQTIRYRITDIVCAPDDSLPNRMRVTVRSNTSWNPAAAGEGGVSPNGLRQWGYTRYNWRYYADNGSHDCSTFSPPATDGTYVLVASAETCYENCRYHAGYTENPYYEVTWVDIGGDLRKKNPTTPKYIDRTTYAVTPYQGHCGGTWNCTNPDPEDISGDGRGDWTLLETDLVDVPINADGDIGTINSAIFDYSQFRYPGKDNDADHPHGWSYKRTTNPQSNYHYEWDDGSDYTDDHFIYLRDHSYSSTWRDAEQKVPFFPSVSGGEFANYLGDDQITFVDLPEVDSTAEDKGDDLAGVNRTAILNFLNLSRQLYLRDTRYVFTMAPINPGSLVVSSSTAQTGNGTPLAATLANARSYFESYIGTDQYTKGGCRDNYIILLTDGLETTLDGDPAAEAQALQNLIVDGVETPVKVYVIGFGLDKASQATLNEIALKGGTTHAYFANDVETLVNILADDITSDILGGTYGRSKAALGANQPGVSASSAIYYASFDYPVWRGHIEAVGLYPEDVFDGTGHITHKQGSLKGLLPYWGNGCSGTYNPPSDLGDADSGCIVAEDNMIPGVPPDGPAVRRTLYTTVAGSRVDFDPSNVVLVKPLVNPDGLDINMNLTGGEDEDAKAIINYVHHPGYDSAKYVGTRDQNWPLADIYNSGLVVVTAPRQGNCVTVGGVEKWNNMDGYCAFKDAQAGREGVIYVGTNGGMIEAFGTGTPEYVDSSGTTIPAVNGGRELWGYLPSFVLGKLNELSDGHRFTMDLTVVAADIDTSTNLTGTGWKTILVAGQRKGGTGYAVLDVTDPSNPLPMWEFTDPNLGQTWSKPSFGRIMINGVRTSVVFFGGGYSPDADKGNRLFIIKASDGALIKEFVVGSSSNNVPSGLRTTRFLIDKVGTVVDYRTNLNKLPNGTTVDYNDWRDFIEAAYFGDTSGTLWRLRDLNNSDAATTADPFGPPWSTNVSLDAMYVPDAADARPIYHVPFVRGIQKGSIDSGVVKGCVKRYVLFGTGSEKNPSVSYDISGAPIIDHYYEIEDRAFGIGENDSGHLPAWTAAEIIDGKFRLNWRMNLGAQVPLDKYGFLLDAAGAKVVNSGKNYLNAQIYIIDKSIYDVEGWSLDSNGHLLNPAGEKVVNKGSFLFDDGTGSLFKESTLSTLVASSGTYKTLDFSLWVNDENGCITDPDDSTCIVDTATYNYDNEGFMTDATGSRISVDGADKKIITDPGEKILSDASGAGGYLYFTSYTPEGGCAMGKSYFYGIEISSCDSTTLAKGAIEYDTNGVRLLSGSIGRMGIGNGIATGVTLGYKKAYVVTSGGGDGAKAKDYDVNTGSTTLLFWKQE